MRSRSIPQARLRWRLALLTLAVLASLAATAVWTNALGAGDRFDRLVARIEAFVDPPPHRATLPTIIVTQQPSPTIVADGKDGDQLAHVTPTPAPVRGPVDVNLVANPNAVFISQLTNKMCAVAGTQMALAVMGLANTSEAFQNELNSRIGEWESWEDSHNGHWGPAAISLAVTAYGAPGYEVRAYESRADALRDD